MRKLTILGVVAVVAVLVATFAALSLLSNDDVDVASAHLTGPDDPFICVGSGVGHIHGKRVFANGTGAIIDCSDSPRAVIIFGSAIPEDIIGSDFDDKIDGGKGGDAICGGGGDDQIDGGKGNDDIFGDNGGAIGCSGGTPGNDHLKGGFGNDELFGEAGDDVLNGGPGDDDLNGGSGGETVGDICSGGPATGPNNGTDTATLCETEINID